MPDTLPTLTRCPGFGCKARRWCRRYTTREAKPGEDWFTERPHMGLFDPPCVVFLSNGTVRDK